MACSRYGRRWRRSSGPRCWQIGANFANDVFDFERGADTHDRLGPQRATQQGWISAAQMKRAMWLCFAAATAVGLYLTYVAGWEVFALGLLSIAAAYLYTGGPKPYGYLGLGDLAVFLFFRPGRGGRNVLRAGTVAVSARAGRVHPHRRSRHAILVVNNLRDIETDARAGKLTLAVRLGDGRTRAYYLLLLGVAYLVPALLWGSRLADAWVMMPWLSLPLALRVAARTRHERGLALNGLPRGHGAARGHLRPAVRARPRVVRIAGRARKPRPAAL